MHSSFHGRARRALSCRALTSLAGAASLLAASFAQAQSGSLDTVVVTANRTPQPLSSVLADISVIDRETIERSGAVGVADLLARLPGIEFARNGGPGTATSVFVRGNESRHTAVYIDGVRVDSQSTGGAVWEQIPLDQIERIEVLRGPAAAIYGSDAIAGVVQVFTKRGQGAAKVSGTLRAGSYHTQQVQAAISGSAQAVDYALSASRARSESYNSRTTATSNPDKDGWNRTAFQGRIGYQLSDQHRVDASLLSTRLNSQYDGFTNGFDDWNHHTLRTGTVGWQGRWSDNATTRVQAGQTLSTYETQPSYYRTETQLRNYTVQHDQRVGAHLLTVTAERREDELLNPAAFVGATTLERRRSQNAVGLGWRGDFGAHGLQAHVRRDDDSEFGGKSTGSLAWGWQFLPQWRVTAAGATSFRVPTLYQRFSEYGNRTLVPESGRNVELGLRWAAAGSEASLSAWRNKVSDLIAFGAPGPCADAFGCYVNVGLAELKGVTLAARTQFAGVNLRGSLDWHDPRSVDPKSPTTYGKVLARRAKRLATFGVDTQLAGWTFGLEAQGAGERYENATNTQRLGGYGVVNLYASRALMRGMLMEARIDNAGDKQYELARTYNTGGRNAQVALRWTTP